MSGLKNQEENIFQSPPKINYSEEALKVNVEEFKKVIISRRSVRVFSSETIPESVVQDCLDMALLAPNSSNLQPWEFYWVKTATKKELLQKACFSQIAATTASELIVCVARTNNWKNINKQMLDFLHDKSDKSKGKAHGAPPQVLNYYEKIVPFAYSQGPLGLFGMVKKALFFVTGFFREVPREPTSKNDMKVWATKSTALACQNLMLAFRAHGFDTCPMEGFDQVRVKRLLDLPRDAYVVMVVAAGKRVPEKIYGKRLRFSREQFIKKI